MKRRLRFVALLLGALSFQVLSHAQAISRDEIPESLAPWVDWVLYGHEEASCPFLSGAGETRQCLWPARLSLKLGDRSGTFRQAWLVHQSGWAALPGGPRLWPQQVRVDGREAVVVPRGKRPGVELEKGRHEITGAFAWNALPPLLQVPRQTGLVELFIDGTLVPFPRRDERGRLWLKSDPEEEGDADRADVVVHRHIVDDIPLILESRIEMQVAGRSREVSLGRALPEGFTPMVLAGPLPARVEADGNLRVQVRPGRWTLTLGARRDGPVDSISLPAHQAPWPAEEVWVFDARPWLRLVDVEGVPGVDPLQTTLPEQWKMLPAYLVEAGQTMNLVQKRRGDSDPAADKLALQRSWWLDFDGSGYSIHDEITGELEQSWRLDMLSPGLLGRAAVNGENQLVTINAGSGNAGVELRQAAIALEADSRVEGRLSRVPAVGWDHDFRQVSGRLHLPPGWRLLHASGVDDVSTTWVATWSLLDLFLVLIITIAIARLWGWLPGVLALVTLVVTWIEPGAPRWLWTLVLAGEALRRVLPQGWAKRPVTLGHRLACGLLVIVAVPFMVQQMRAALYPALERSPAVRQAALKGVPMAAPPMADDAAVQEGEAGLLDYVTDELSSAEPQAVSLSRELTKTGNFYVADPKAVVQTGAGLPDWSWRQVHLSWRGPVERTQQLQLVLLPRWVNSALALLRVLLLALLVLRLLPIPPGSWPGTWLSRLGLVRVAPALFLVLATVLLAPGTARAEIPDAELLDELRTRLLQNPECFPACAVNQRLILEASPTDLTLRLELHAAAETAAPLPGAAGQWMPDRVMLDGAAAAGLVRTADGRLWILLAEGRHQVVVSGPLPDSEVVSLPLPLRPHQVQARVDGWRLEGLQEDGVPSDNLQLLRNRTAASEATAGFEAGHLPAFVRVERQLQLGLQWHVLTRVVRMTPTGTPIVLDIPLLPGESVITEGVPVSDGHASINMAAGAGESSWSSTLQNQDAIELMASASTAWTEVWSVAASQVWHLEADGIPPVRPPRADGPRILEWRPWPGETVTIHVTRPDAVSGRTLTIDSSALTLKPGIRATDATLELVLRSSRGTQHTLALPETASLQSVSIDGNAHPIRQDGRDVTLPVRPGRQEIALEWRQTPGIGIFFQAPDVRLGVPSVNATTVIVMPRDRWTLFLKGPRLGPAVLFWSFLLVALLVSVGLGRIRATPLRWYHWLLLSFGLTQVSIWIALPIVAWILGLAWRRDHLPAMSDAMFDVVQLALAFMTLLALLSLFIAVERGLLGLPEMQIAGNRSSSGMLRWYLDRVGDALPRPWALSLPILAYRLAMLAWALWLAQALLSWLRWGWACFKEGQLWRPVRLKDPKPSP